MTRRPTVLALMVLVGISAALAARADESLTLPAGAEQTASLQTPYATYTLPVGPWENDKIPAISLTGVVTQQAWRIPGNGPETLKLAEALRASLAAQGYAAIFACATDACGGFDFRYETDLLPEPEMHVDLSDFRYLSAVRGQGPQADYVGLMVSRAGDTGFVQLTRIGATDTPATTPRPITPADPAPATGAPVEGQGLTAELETAGRAVLAGLSFSSGSAELASDNPASLSELAEYLQRRPDAKVLIVGHTDASGGLAANIALSRERARAVADRLIAAYGIDPGRITAEGVGPLAPLTGNLTPEGREKNRRVEAVLASTR